MREVATGFTILHTQKARGDKSTLIAALVRWPESSGLGISLASTVAS